MMTSTNQRDKQQTKTMRAKVNYQENPSDTNEQTTTLNQQAINWPTRLPQPVSHPDQPNDPTENGGGYNLRTRRQNALVGGRSANYRSVMPTKQPTEQRAQQYRHRQTIPLQIELDNSLYQLKELDIKCLLIVEQPIVEYSAQLSVTNTPMNNPAIKPSNIQQSSNSRIGQSNQAGFSDSTRMSQSNQSGGHHRQTNIDGKTQQSSSSSDSIHLVSSSKILFVLLLIVMIQ